jgi:hypothetical protein
MGEANNKLSRIAGEALDRATSSASFTTFHVSQTEPNA